MPAYPSATALLADAALRLDRFGQSRGVLVVEGPDDKRLLCDRSYSRQQVLVTGGRRLLLSAHSLLTTEKLSGILFLTDCDYEVPSGTLSPSQDLIITRHADVEADLLDVGGFEAVVLHLVPAALNEEDDLLRISSEVRERSIALAEPLGRIRRIAKSEAVEIDTDIRHHRYRKTNAVEVDEERLTRAIWQASDFALPLQEFKERVDALDRSYNNCNGHDLVAACNHVLREDFGVRDQTSATIAMLLRTVIPERKFARLDFMDRIRRWEERTGRKIFVPSPTDGG